MDRRMQRLRAGAHTSAIDGGGPKVSAMTGTKGIWSDDPVVSDRTAPRPARKNCTSMYWYLCIQDGPIGAVGYFLPDGASLVDTGSHGTGATPPPKIIWASTRGCWRSKCVCSSSGLTDAERKDLHGCAAPGQHPLAHNCCTMHVRSAHGRMPYTNLPPSRHACKGHQKVGPVPTMKWHLFAGTRRRFDPSQQSLWLLSPSPLSALAVAALMVKAEHVHRCTPSVVATRSDQAAPVCDVDFILVRCSVGHGPLIRH